MRITSTRANAERRGVVLLVVMAMLALFASLALSFVFYADSEAVSAEAFRSAVTLDQPDVDRELLASYFLSQFLYDTDNVYSAMRGWSLARSLYGYNPGYGAVPGTLSYTPFNGVDRKTAITGTETFPVFGSISYHDMFNYTKYESGTPDLGDPLFGIERRPEYNGKNDGISNFGYVGGANPPWTAYDTNNLFLAAVDASGKVIMPSFKRSWHPDPSDKRGRYTSLRPHKSWHTNFPDPEVPGDGDVRNLEFGPGAGTGPVYYNNDSFWMDLGFPVLTAKDGKRYKALFAPLVMDLSNRLHLWAHGNRIGTGNSHVSNLGIGSTEVNIGHVLSNAAERDALFNLKYGSTNPYPAGTPVGFGVGGGGGQSYSLQDYDGVAPLGLPTSGVRGYSTRPMHFSFGTNAKSAVPGGGAPQTMQVYQSSGTSNRGFKWTIYPGMTLRITELPPLAGKVAKTETVVVQSVDYTTDTFVAPFVNSYLKDSTSVTFGSPQRGAPYFPFGWDNVAGGSPAENTQHPLGLNTSPLLMSQMEALLRHGGTNSPALLSDLFVRMPTTLSDIRKRNMVTLHSSHFDRVTGSPFLTADPAGANQYVYDPKLGYPTLAPGLPTAPSWSTPAPPPKGDFGTDWRSTLGTEMKVNLNRPLTDFPPAAGAFLTGANLVIAQGALADRQAFARDVYNALVRATGARDPNKVAGMVATSPDFQASRWLAQLAANIVDYVDNDVYSTPFLWYTDKTNYDYVFGVELPSAVLSEVYIQLDNDPFPVDKGLDPASKTPAAMHYKQNVWLELDNPVAGTTSYLEINDTPIHRVLLYDSDPTLTASLSNNPPNPRISYGEPDPATFTPVRTVNIWDPATPSTVTLTGAQYRGFGPQTTFLPGRDPGLATTFSSLDLTIQRPLAAAPTAATLLLQRLAMPFLPPQNNPALPLYNPYVTIDYLDNINVNDNREFNGTGPVKTPATNTFETWGRRQPLMADPSHLAKQTGGPGSSPRNTFQTGNNPRTSPVEWMTHLDRKLVNPLEILHVSGVRPHELTQKFMDPSNAMPFRHIAPWPVQNTMLYRALELFGVPNQLAGTIPGGRHPGIVNLNTITEAEIFYAICDAQDFNPTFPVPGPNPTQPNSVPLFTSAQVKSVFDGILRSRNKSIVPTIAPTVEPNPFQPFNTSDLTKSLAFRTDLYTGGSPLFLTGGGNDHPYLRAALMQKIYNNVTTTSNVFAVWWTVGFFEVEPGDDRPAKLGVEIGRAENRHIRHRFFAIVDRSAMNLFQTASTAATTGSTSQWNSQFAYVAGNTVLYNGLTYQCSTGNTGNPPATSPAFWNVVTMTVTAPTGLAGTVPITLQKGMLLEIGAGATGEVVRVENVVSATQFQGAFTKNHAAGSPVICRGNPGPRQNYNPKQDSQVVLHLSVIQ